MLATVSDVARKLDEVLPGWAKPIDLREFDISDANHCISAYNSQRVQDFETLYDMVGVEDCDESPWFASSSLNEVWEIEIKARQNGHELVGHA